MHNPFIRKGFTGATALVSLFFLATPTLAWLPTSDHPWPQFHGDYNHTGYTAIDGPKTGTLKWRYQATDGGDGAPPTSVAVDSHGIVYVGTPTKIVALRADGTVKWHKNYTNVQGPAISPNGKSIYFSGNNRLVKIKRSNGDKQWVYHMDDSTIFGPTIGPDGTIYQGSWDQNLYAINPDGTLGWKFPTAGAISYPASVNEHGTVFLGAGDSHSGTDGHVYAIKHNGTERCNYDTGTDRAGSPAIGQDGLIYVAAAPTLYVLNKNCELQWSDGPNVGGGDGGDDGGDGDDLAGLHSAAADDVAGIITPGIANDGRIYLGNSNGVIMAIDPDTHETLWSYQTDASSENVYGIPSFPVVDGHGRVYMGAMDGKMYALKRDGTLLWAYATDGAIAEAAPALGADGTLYFSSDDGYVYAIQD